MKIIQSILTKNPCYKAGKKITVKGLMLHSVGCSQPKASVFINSWNKESYKRACVHAFIDANSGEVYQTLPWNHRGWHCGGSGNNTYIGVEMCEPGSIQYAGGVNFICTDKVKAKEAVCRTYQSAVQLFAYLCKIYHLNPLADGIILSHQEGYKRRIASNHGDPQHLWKGLGLGFTMDGFRRDVKEAMTKQMTEPEGIYLVKVEMNLNIRKGPGTNYGKTGKYTGMGIFTIVEETDGQGATKWRRLKSGSGWISLDYAKRVS